MFLESGKMEQVQRHLVRSVERYQGYRYPRFEHLSGGDWIDPDVPLSIWVSDRVTGYVDGTSHHEGTFNVSSNVGIESQGTPKIRLRLPSA